MDVANNALVQNNDVRIEKISATTVTVDIICEYGKKCDVSRYKKARFRSKVDQVCCYVM